MNGLTSRRASRRLESDPLILDTETTGLGDDVQVIDARGQVLLDTLALSRPTPRITDAEHRHGRRSTSVTGLLVIAYGADFDVTHRGRYGPEAGCARCGSTRSLRHRSLIPFGAFARVHH
mgnify:CR=1 FL=1